MGIHCLLPFPRKLKRFGRPARLLLFLRDKFVVRRQLKRSRKNRNSSLVQESTHLAAVTITADGCVNNIKFASYLTGNQPLTCNSLQRDSNLLIYVLFFMSYTESVNTGFAKGEAFWLLRPNSSRSTFNEKTYIFSNMLKRIENTYNEFLITVSLELPSAGETVYLKTKKIARTHENITFCNTISFGFAKPQEHTDREITP